MSSEEFAVPWWWTDQNINFVGAAFEFIWEEKLALPGSFVDWLKAYLIQYPNDDGHDTTPIREYWDNYPHKTYPSLSLHVKERMGDFDIGLLRQSVEYDPSETRPNPFERAFDYDYYNGMDVFCCYCTIQDPEAGNRKPVIAHDRYRRQPRCIRCGCTQYIWKFTEQRSAFKRGNDLEELKYLFKEAQTKVDGLEGVLSPSGLAGDLMGGWLKNRSGLKTVREVRPGERDPDQLDITEFFPSKELPT